MQGIIGLFKKFCFLFTLFFCFTFSIVLAHDSGLLPFSQADLKSPLKDHAPYPNDYYTISEVELTKVGEIPLVLTSAKKENGALGELLMIVDGLIAVGKKLWPIVEAGKPSIDATFYGVSVIPPGNAQDQWNFDQIFSWSQPKSVHYQVIYKNLFGITVANFIYSLQFQHSGQTLQGGQYITALKVVPQMIGVSWGFSFNASSELASITNHGTPEKPLAGADLEISYRLRSVVKEIRSKHSLHLTGDGNIQDLSL
jgi:hypothetical protein